MKFDVEVVQFAAVNRLNVPELAAGGTVTAISPEFTVTNIAEIPFKSIAVTKFKFDPKMDTVDPTQPDVGVKLATVTETGFDTVIEPVPIHPLASETE